MEKISKFLRLFAARRTAMTIVAAIVGILLISMMWSLLSGPESTSIHRADSSPAALAPHNAETATIPHPSAQDASPGKNAERAPAVTPPAASAPTDSAPHAPGRETAPAAGPAHSAQAPHTAPQAPQTASPGHSAATPVPGHGTGKQTQGSDTQIKPVSPPGVAMVEATIIPLQYELKERFWGWRPNDILDFTDNVNSYQLGVLEVTRRTVVQLTERISRTGSTASLNPNLENAMNWLMVTAQRYWFPSPESKYLESLEELEKYKTRLMDGKASFYTRADNLIPLLAAYEDLLGSCDENLVKLKEADGADVAFFTTDDYFYYAKGVANSMAGILEGVLHDFSPTLEGRHGAELLHHAILSCQRAAAIDPILIIDAGLDSIFANHRAHMAAPISHARFYLGQLIKTLST